MSEQVQNPTASSDNGVSTAVYETSIGEKINATAHDVAERARARVRAASDKVAQKVDEAADAARETARERLEGAADKIEGDTEPGTLRHRAGTKVRSMASYIGSHGIRGMATDLTDVVKTHPVKSMMIGIGVGYLFGRFLRR